MIEAETKYWDVQWADRIGVDGYSVKGNKEKFEKIIKYLWSVPQYYKLDKLDVGCGPAHHAIAMDSFFKDFADSWTGIDLSEVAVKCARKHGLNAICADFLEYDFKRTYDIFFFWDSLEHFDNLSLVAKKLQGIRRDKIRICGNIPLFLSEIHNNGGVEHPMDINKLQKFINSCGCTRIWYEVYGTHGFPFLLFDTEGHK
jgi:SAM-dependent methyltransferase